MPTTTQAVILARGLGTRMQRDDGVVLGDAQRAAAAGGAKGMMPITGGRPFLDYVLSALADGGITEVVLVVPPDHATMREYFTRTAPPTRVTIRFAVQEQPRGTADAVFAARDAVRNVPFLALNADNLYSPETVRAVAALDTDGLAAFEAGALVTLSGIEPERVLRFALLDIGADDRLVAIVEKPAPDHPLAVAAERWVSMNLWSFTPVIFDACARVQPSVRGELELQSAVTIAMRDLGVPFRVARVRDGVLDLSHRGDVGAVSARLAGVVPRP